MVPFAESESTVSAPPMRQHEFLADIREVAESRAALNSFVSRLPGKRLAIPFLNVTAQAATRAVPSQCRARVAGTRHSQSAWCAPLDCRCSCQQGNFNEGTSLC